MRELRRPSALASLGTLVILLASAAAASADVASAHLVVQGPLDMAGASETHADGGILLLDGAGAPGSDQLRVVLHAADATLLHSHTEAYCAPTAPHIADVALPPVADRLQRLDLDALLSLLPSLPAPFANVAQSAVQAGAAAAQPLASQVNAALDQATRAAAPGAVPSLPCLPTPEGSQGESKQLSDLRLEVTAADADYIVFWDSSPSKHTDRDGTEHHTHGAATLQAEHASARLLTEMESIQLIHGDDAGFGDPPESTVDAGWVRSDAPAARGNLLGDGTLTLNHVTVHVTGVDTDGNPFDESYTTGEHRDPTLPVSSRRITEYLELDGVTGVAGSYQSPGGARLYAEQATTQMDGTLSIPEAHGDVTDGDQTTHFDGGRALLRGTMVFTLQGVDSPDQVAMAPGAPASGAPDGAMALDVDGSAVQVASAGPAPAQDSSDGFPGGAMGKTAAAVSAFALGAGVLAWFWPSLKFLIAPLYTRIAPDAVLAHSARENIYRLIKAEPGIHAHEVASRLTLGWGTTVYHLKLLERNGLVVARHEGRYKRFFVTGDQRLQHQGAVALLRNPTSRSIAGVVAQRPGMIQKQVCEALGLSPSLASWHLQRLEAAGLVRAERLGRSVRYAPGPAWVELQAMEPLTAFMPAASVMPPAGPQPAAAP